MLIYIIRKIYNLLFIILLPFLFLKFFIKSLKLPAYRARLLERLGIFSIPIPNNNNNIWIHAVSVGEFMSSIPIIQAIQKKIPNACIVVTCTTPTGSSMIQKIKKKLSMNLIHIYFPLDIDCVIKNFLTRIKPKLLIIIEKEIWPNIIFNCHKNNIPIIIANAQLSNKSFYKYKLIKPLIAACLNKITFICTQTTFDTFKLKKLNANGNNIILTGNSKFDIAWQNSYNNINKKNINQLIWIAASTHPIEEQIILEAHKAILQKIPNALLILAPRHPERSQNIAKFLASLNFTFIIHSKKSILSDPNSNINAQIYLVDSIGELNMLYGISQAAFVGGSLVPIGGHNVLEPASHAIPIAIGPYTANCQQIVFRLKLANGLVKINNAQELSKIIIQWLTDANIRKSMGNNAKNYLYNETGASEKIAIIARGLLSLR